MAHIRLKEVAAEAGVSISTAAAALRGESIVAPPTRKRVEKAAKKLRYRKNSAAAALSSLENRKSQKAVSVVWLTAIPDIEKAPHQQVRTSIRWARETAEELGLLFEDRNISSRAEGRRILKELENRGVDGIIWSRCQIAPFPKLPKNRFCVVSTDQTSLQEGFDVVRRNYFRCTLNLLIRIQKMGYRRIGICLREHTPIHPDDEARYGASETFRKLYVHQKDRIPILRLAYGKPREAEILNTWRKKYHPEVIVSSNREEMNLLERSGLKIPKDLSYVAFHVRKKEQGLLAGLQINAELIPVYAVRALVEKIQHGKRAGSTAPRETVISPPYLPGSSCPFSEKT